MKIIKTILLTGGLFSLPLISSAQVFKNADLAISKLKDHIWVIETTKMESMYLIEGKDKAMLIDTGTKCDSLDKVVRKITQKPVYVVITHAHPDHVGNVRYFQSIYLHADDTTLMKSYQYKGKINFIKDGDTFDLGGITLEVYHMPAHTPGSIVLIDKEHGDCYSGDSFGSGQVWLQVPPVAPIATYISSCLRMLKLMDNGIQRIYCGHYPYLKQALDRTYMSDMLTLAQALEKNTPVNAAPYATKLAIGTQTPMITTLNMASIVYDPEHLH
jgi:hydroxyacylglutathione hydrolase